VSSTPPILSAFIIIGDEEVPEFCMVKSKSLYVPFVTIKTPPFVALFTADSNALALLKYCWPKRLLEMKKIKIMR
jgi:hypothetical protein